MQLTLDQLKAGSLATIEGFQSMPSQSSAQSFRRKLLALGVTPGAELEVIRFAPLGDPMEIKIRGFSLSLRKHEAEIIQVAMKSAAQTTVQDSTDTLQSSASTLN